MSRLVQRSGAIEWIDVRTPFEIRYAFGAAVFTLGVFVLIPALDLLSPWHRSRLAVHPVEPVQAPPPLPPPRSRPAPEPSRTPLPKPRLPAPRLTLPVEAVLTLDVARADITGGFALDVGVSTPDLLAEVTDYVFEMSDVDTPPQPMVRTEPVYPPAARFRRIEGEVRVEFVVDVDGSVHGVEVVRSDPPGVFDDAALRAVQRWKFVPGTYQGRVVPVRVRQRLEFTWDRP